MSDTSKGENLRAAREARESLASSHAGSSGAAVAAAMRRYLRTEQYHALREDAGQSVSEPDPTDHAG